MTFKYFIALVAVFVLGWIFAVISGGDDDER